MEYGKKFHGYEKYGYKFSINICCGKEIKYNYEWHRWMFYQFGFHIDVENVYDRIKVPVIHFSNDERIECNEDEVIELFNERKKLLDLKRSLKRSKR